MWRRYGAARMPSLGSEENAAADQLELSSEQIERLNNLTPAAGARHEEAQMAVIDR
jgi:hypothetical protein